MSDKVPMGMPLEELLERATLLGSGSYGAVFAPWDYPHLVVKVFGLSASVEEEAKAYRQARRLLGADCKIFPQLVAVNRRDKALLLQRAPGLTLTDFLECLSGVLPHRLLDTDEVDQLFSVAKALLAAVSQLSAAGLVHRDLKPENIMLDLGEDGEPKITLIDIGLLVESGQGDPGRNYSTWWRSPHAEENTATEVEDCHAAVWSVILGLLPLGFKREFCAYDGRKQVKIMTRAWSPQDREAHQQYYNGRFPDGRDFDEAYPEAPEGTWTMSAEPYLLSKMEECPAKKGLAEMFRLALRPMQSAEMLSAMEAAAKPPGRKTYLEVLMGR